MTAATWIRLAHITTNGAHFEELVHDGPHVFIRRGQPGKAPKDILHVKQTEGQASTMVKGRIALLRKKGWQLDKPVLRPLPANAPPKPPPKPTRTKADEEFIKRLPRFVREYTALGLDPTLSFEEEALRSSKTLHPKLHPNEAAYACMRMVQTIFGVSWTYRTRSFDDEHGYVQTIGEDRLWEFYEDPCHVLSLARAKLNGKALRIDDHDPARGEDVGRLITALLARQ